MIDHAKKSKTERGQKKLQFLKFQIIKYYLKVYQKFYFKILVLSDNHEISYFEFMSLLV